MCLRNNLKIKRYIQSCVAVELMSSIISSWPCFSRCSPLTVLLLIIILFRLSVAFWRQFKLRFFKGGLGGLGRTERVAYLESFELKVLFCLYQGGQAYIIVHNLPIDLTRLAHRSNAEQENHEVAEVANRVAPVVPAVSAMPITIVKSAPVIAVDSLPFPDYDGRRFHVLQAPDGQVNGLNGDHGASPVNSKPEYAGSCPVCGDRISGIR